MDFEDRLFFDIEEMSENFHKFNMDIYEKAKENLKEEKEFLSDEEYAIALNEEIKILKNESNISFTWLNLNAKCY